MDFIVRVLTISRKDDVNSIRFILQYILRQTLHLVRIKKNLTKNYNLGVFYCEKTIIETIGDTKVCLLYTKVEQLTPLLLNSADTQIHKNLRLSSGTFSSGQKIETCLSQAAICDGSYYQIYHEGDNSIPPPI